MMKEPKQISKCRAKLKQCLTAARLVSTARPSVIVLRNIARATYGMSKKAERKRKNIADAEQILQLILAKIK